MLFVGRCPPMVHALDGLLPCPHVHRATADWPAAPQLGRTKSARAAGPLPVPVPVPGARRIGRRQKKICNRMSEVNLFASHGRCKTGRGGARWDAKQSTVRAYAVQRASAVDPHNRGGAGSGSEGSRTQRRRTRKTGREAARRSASGHKTRAHPSKPLPWSSGDRRRHAHLHRWRRRTS